MTRSTIGGQLTPAALALLHRPPGAAQLADAQDYTRRALAALKAIDDAGQVTGDQHAAIGRFAAALRDCCDELDRVHVAVTRGRP